MMWAHSARIPKARRFSSYSQQLFKNEANHCPQPIAANKRSENKTTKVPDTNSLTDLHRDNNSTTTFHTKTLDQDDLLNADSNYEGHGHAQSTSSWEYLGNNYSGRNT